jgi:hypothetical protein
MRSSLIRRLVSLLLFASLYTQAQSSLACRCREPDSPAAAYKAAYAVARGKLSTLTSPAANGNVEATLQVESAWKAALPSSIRITTGSDCAFPFVAGESYLLFVVRTPEGSFTTGRCMGNRTLAEAGAFLTWLDKNGAREAKTPAAGAPSDCPKEKQKQK